MAAGNVRIDSDNDNASLIIWARHDQGRPIEISSPPTSPFQGEIYLAGAIHNPGAYPLMAGDTVEGIIQASGAWIRMRTYPAFAFMSAQGKRETTSANRY